MHTVLQIKTLKKCYASILFKKIIFGSKKTVKIEKSLSVEQNSRHSGKWQTRGMKKIEQRVKKFKSLKLNKFEKIYSGTSSYLLIVPPVL